MQDRINQIIRDEFGRAHGILAIDKPAGATSHDMVAVARGALKTKKVGHAGALDPFATGVLILLVGKFTKLSDQFLNADKEYRAQILFGISTDSADPEGQITKFGPNAAVTAEDISAVLPRFIPQYTQHVPIYSSVKVNGEKLRVLARRADRHEIVEKDGQKVAIFYTGDKQTEVVLPQHICRIPKLQLVETGATNIADTEFYHSNAAQLGQQTEFASATIDVACSKGTYIRTLAEDIGAALNPPVPAMLVTLARTRVSDITLDKALSIEQLRTLS